MRSRLGRDDEERVCERGALARGAEGLLAPEDRLKATSGERFIATVNGRCSESGSGERGVSREGLFSLQEIRRHGCSELSRSFMRTAVVMAAVSSSFYEEDSLYAILMRGVHRRGIRA